MHRTAENIAAALHPSVVGDSRLAEVKEALRALEAAHEVRLGDGGYRIPTPAEDDWERTRMGISAKPGDMHRIYGEVLNGFWQPQPSHTLLDTRLFKAGLAIHGREAIAGEIPFHIHLADSGKPFDDLAAELRSRSQQERKCVFWAVALTDTIARETEELYRSKEMLARKEREARTADETALIGEEKLRLRRHQDELRRLLKNACLAGNVYVRGNDRSPGDRAVEVGKAASEILGAALPDVFERYKEAAAKPNEARKALDALLAADNLAGLPKKGVEFEELVRAAEAFRDTFGSEVRKLSASAIAAELREQIARHEDAVATSYGVLVAERLPGAALLEGAQGQIKAVLRGPDERAIATFNAAHKTIKDAFKRAAELEQALTEPRLRDLQRARKAIDVSWPFLKDEWDLPDSIRAHAEELQDQLSRETFYRDLPAIETAARTIETEYRRRFDEALQARVQAYSAALALLARTPGWGELTEDLQQRIAAPLERGTAPEAEGVPIPQLGSEREACEARLKAAITEVLRIVEGERIVAVNLGSYFSGGIETEEQLDAALAGIREECARLIGAGKKVVIQ